jgi:pimeloyl-ACP methyl ester carboxylesterase
MEAEPNVGREAKVVLGALKFHYLEWPGPAADSPSLVLLHGFNQTRHSWDEFAARASGEFRILALDQRGHGDSDRPHDGDYGREVMADDAARLATHADVETFGLIGMSMGAYNAMVMAARYPERVRSLVIVDQAPEVERVGLEAIKQIAALQFESFEDAVQAVHAYNPRRSLDNLRSRLSHSMRQDAAGRWIWKVDAEGLLRSPRLKEPTQALWDIVARVPCPTLVVRGEQSDIVSAATVERAARTLPHGELVTVSGAGHSVPGDNPEGFFEAVMPFLRRTCSR